jgi:aspartate/methionine/tyrosine aminotransferase
VRAAAGSADRRRGVPRLRARAPAGSFASTRGALAFALSGLSKLAGLPQLKLGWLALAGPEPVRKAARDRLEFIADAYLSVGAPVQHAAAALLGLRGELQRQIRERVAESERRLRERCAGAAELRLLEREGGWYAVLELSEHRRGASASGLSGSTVCWCIPATSSTSRTRVLVVILLTPPADLDGRHPRVIESAKSM